MADRDFALAPTFDLAPRPDGRDGIRYHVLTYIPTRNREPGRPAPDYQLNRVFKHRKLKAATRRLASCIAGRYRIGSEQAMYIIASDGTRITLAQAQVLLRYAK